MSQCPFCAIAAGTQPASVVWQDDRALAFLDLRQAVRGHVLVVPRTHAATLFDLDEDAAAHLMRIAHRVACAVERAWSPAGLNLWQSNREAGGQEVSHVHLHVQPREVGDGLLHVYPHGAPTTAPRARLQEWAQQLRQQLRAP